MLAYHRQGDDITTMKNHNRSAALERPVINPSSSLKLYCFVIQPVSLSIISLRFSKVPSSLYGTYENLKLRMFSETGTRFVATVIINLQIY